MRAQKQAPRFPIWAGWILLVLLALLYAWKTDFPPMLSFDEEYYVPAARQILASGRDPNFEHPPFGKLLIGQGIRLLGDSPHGWRLAVILCGIGSLVCVFLLGLQLFRSPGAAALTVFLTGTNQMHYVQSRTAMLDGFMAFFLLAGFCLLLRDTSHKWRTNLAGISCLALSVAIKWSALPYFCVGLALSAWALRTPSLRVSLWRALLLLMTGLLVYRFTYLPIEGDFLELQAKAFQRQISISAPHPYASSIGSWPWLTSPIWFGFGQSVSPTNPADIEYCGILQAGNPVFFWGGLIALISCFLSYLRRRDRLSLAIVLFFILSLTSWTIIPRKVLYHYYYYPSSFILAFAWTQWLRGPRGSFFRPRILALLLLAQVAMFWFLLPTSNGTCLSQEDFLRRMILDEWRPRELPPRPPGMDR